MLCVSAFSAKHLLMPSSWSCSSIISPNPTAPHSTDWAGMYNFTKHGAFCVSLLSLVLDSPVKPVLVAHEVHFKQREGCVHVVLTHSFRCLCSNKLVSSETRPHPQNSRKWHKHSGVPVNWGGTKCVLQMVLCCWCYYNCMVIEVFRPTLLQYTRCQQIV